MVFKEKKGRGIPEMSDEWVNQISERYIELFEKVTGKKFEKDYSEDILGRVEANINGYLISKA